MSVAEVTDLFSTVQVVQRMLGRYYFAAPSTKSDNKKETMHFLEAGGSFNIAVQDGPEAGQTVGHVHVHVIPRIRDVSAKDAETPSDELYEWMAAEKGNVGGALWDRDNGHDHHLHHGQHGQHHHLQHTSTFGQQPQEDDCVPEVKRTNGDGSEVQIEEVGELLKEEEQGMAMAEGQKQARPKPGGSFPRIEDAMRTARGMEEMEREAAEYRRVLEEMGIESV